MAIISVWGNFRGRHINVRWEDGRVDRDQRFLEEEDQKAHDELLEAAGLDGPGRLGPQTFRERALTVLENPEFLEDHFSGKSEASWEKDWYRYGRREYLIVHTRHLGYILAILVTIDVTLQVDGLWRIIAWVAVFLLLVYVLLVGAIGDLWHEWTPWIERWKSKWEQPRFIDWILAFVVLTGAFGVLTALLYDEGVVTGDVTYESHLVLVFSSYYFWHFLDAIPALSVPETLNWKAPATLNGLDSGAMLLLYKLLVIVPVVGAVRALLARRTP